jgi:naringenin degradation protein FdeE
MAGQRTAVRRVLVVGAGLAGLSLAISLGRAGVGVAVIDVTDQVERVGIGLIGRVMFALEELGVLTACRSTGWVLPGSTSIFTFMFDASGRPLTVPPLAEPVDTRLPGAIMMYRPELIRILREEALRHGATLRYGLTVQSMDQSPDAVDVGFTDGSTGRYDLVVGADGVRSRIRGLLHGHEVRPTYTGETSLRWVLNQAPTGSGGFYCAKGTIVAVSRLPHAMAFVSTGYSMPNTHVGQPEAVRLLRQVLDKFTAPYIVELRQRLAGDQEVNVRPYEWLLVEPPWHRGRVAIIGDAAHATTAHLTSIGGMAFEDAVVLGQELTRRSTVAEALDAFQRRRTERVRLVVDTSVELLRMQLEDADIRTTAGVRNHALARLAAPY